MASGDTKTESMLNVLGNGGSADEFRGCCNTKTQQYILDAIDRVQDVEDEVEELKNNPDVVDIVDTYADLQAYDTQHLTENDIIRVLQDETHDGNSTYYRWNSATSQFDFVGEIAGGDSDPIKMLTASDYNWNSSTWTSENPNAIALWLLDEGFYTTDNNARIYVNNTTSVQNTAVEGNIIYVSRKYAQLSTQPGTEVSITFLGGRIGDGMPTGTTYATDTVTGYARGYSGNRFLNSQDLVSNTGTSTTKTMTQKAITDALASVGGPTVVQNTGTSTTDVMSQNATTSMVFADPSDKTKVKIGNSNTFIDGAAATGIVIGSNAKNYGDNSLCVGSNSIVNLPKGVALGARATANGSFSVALGTGATASANGELNVGTGSIYTTSGYNGTNYRLISGVHAPVSDHDAATKGYVDSSIANSMIMQRITNFEYNFDSTDPTNTDPQPEDCNSWALWKFPSYGVAFLSYENGLGNDIYIQGGSNPQTIADSMGAEAATAGFIVGADINGVVNTAIYSVIGQMGPFQTDASTGEPA